MIPWKVFTGNWSRSKGNDKNTIMISGYKIVDAESIDRQAWQDYVDRHEQGGVFHTPYMYDALARSSQFIPFDYFAMSSTGEIKAMLAGYTQSVKGGAIRHLSTRAVLLASPIYDSREALSGLIREVKGNLPGKPIYTEVRNSHTLPGYREVMESAGFSWEGHYNIVKELPDDVETLWRQISRKRKDGINKAKKLCYIFEEENTQEAIDTFYSLMRKSYKRIKLPVPSKDLFQNFLIEDKGKISKIFQLRDSTGVKISLFSFLHKHTLYAYYIGTDDDKEFLRKRPVDLFYYKLMTWCIEHELRFFDWMGAGKPGVQYGVRDFKLQYGGELVDYGRLIHVNSPFRYKLGAMGLKLLQKIGRVN